MGVGEKGEQGEHEIEGVHGKNAGGPVHETERTFSL